MKNPSGIRILWTISWLLSLQSIFLSTTILEARCYSQRRRAQEMERYYFKPPLNTPITIYIHGGGQPIFSFFILSTLFSYAPRGFAQAIKLSCSYSLSKLAYTLPCLAFDEFPAEGIYTFGWSGLLSFSERRKVGAIIYRALRALRDDPDYADTPITIITHSHGGNVALNIARAAEECGDCTLNIERLVITACPVQKETENYINSPIFKKVYALYSQSDLIQVLDPQGLVSKMCPYLYKTPLFSKRRFPPSPTLLQAEIKFNDRATPGHLGFLSKKFLYQLPEILRMLEDQQIRAFLPRDCKNSYCLSINKRGGYCVEGCKTREERDYLRKVRLGCFEC